MFFAHLPAGYLTARLVARHLGATATPGLILAGMAGGVFPDIDLVYGTWDDAGQVHHHRYWTHLPLVWLIVSGAALAWPQRPGALRRHVVVFLLAVWGHLLLDSVAGDIWWLWPWLDTPFSLTDIPAIHAPWWLNFLLHWSLALELAIIALALGWEHTRPLLTRHAGGLDPNVLLP